MNSADAPLPNLSAEDVGRYYDQITAFYHIIWGESIHVGYWPDPAENISMEDAQDHYTDLMIHHLRIQPGEQLLDVGCGTGEPALRLIRTTGAKVTGITISQVQVDSANQRAREQGLSDSAHFELVDAMMLPYEDESFDAAWALETLFHMPDRGQVLREIARVLRPGGRLVIAEAIETGTITDEQRAILWNGVQANSYITFDAYVQAVKAAGFSVDKEVDITHHTNNTLNWTMKRLEEPDRQAQLCTYYDEEFITMVRQAWKDVVDEYRATMGYMMLTAHKLGA